jgi:PAS domain S-box-containing protein
VELWGRRPIIGRSRWTGAWRLYTSDGRPLRPEDSATAVCLRDGEPMRGTEFVIERPDGTRAPVMSWPAPLRDASGRVAGAITLLIDMTVQMGALAESRRLAAIVEGSDDAIIAKTLDGKVMFWNGGATRIFGYTAQQMVGQPITRIIPPDRHDEELDIFATVARGERVEHYDTERVARDGRRIVVSLTVSALRDAAGNIVGVIGNARDISERTRAEETLRLANEAAQHARREAESANRAKTEFLAVMSHEIRTPLNSITGFVDLLAETELTAQQRRYTDLVKTANAALLTVVNDILDFSKVEAGQLDLDLQPFAPAALIRDAVAIVAPAAAAKRLLLKYTIDRGVPEWVTGDPARLRQILLNLLNNAVKFTDKGEIAIDVRQQVAADGRTRIRFSVADTGIGVPADQQRHLFKKFSQADSSVSRRHGGTGLGLAICKRMVELMNGEIAIDSELGRGTTVSFTALMPAVSKPAPQPAGAPPVEDFVGSKARILVIDDIDTNREIVEAFLQDRDYEVVCVSRGLEGIELLASGHFDLVLMDIQMPDIDGVTATRLIRALPGPIKDVPIIAMTGNVLPQQVRSFLDAGMNDHVGKPIERAKLNHDVRLWLAQTQGPGRATG